MRLLMVNHKAIYVLLVIILLVAVGVLASVIGNIGNRRVQSTQDINMQILQPIVPGVATTLRWDVPIGSNQDVVFHLRTSSLAQTIGTAKLGEGEAELVFPCTLNQTTGSLVMIQASNEKVIAWSRVRMLLPGQDCLP